MELKGNGWTVGGYLGWRLLPGVRFEAGGSYSGISYDGVAGTAAATFPGRRWLGSAALVGTIKTAVGFELENSARVYGLWEHDGAYTDMLGVMQTERNFSTGRASVRHQGGLRVDVVGDHDGHPLCRRLRGLLFRQR